MATVTDPVRFVEDLSTLGVLLVVAALLLHPRGRPATRAALAVLLLCFAAETAVGLLFKTGGLGSDDTWSTWLQHLQALDGPLAALFLVLYPQPPVRGSWQRAAVGACSAVLVLGALLWFLDPASLFAVYPGFTAPSTNRGILWRLTLGEGKGLAIAVLLGLALLRTRGAPEREGRAAFALLPLLFVGGFIIDGLALWQATAEGLGLPYGVPNVLVFVPGDCCRIAPLVWALSVVAGLVVAWAAFHFRRAPAAALLVLDGYLAAASGSAGIALPTLPAIAVWPAVGALYVMSTYDALGGLRIPARARWGLVLVVFGLTFVSVATSTIAGIGSDPLGQTWTMLQGFLYAGFAAYLVMPPEDRPFGRPARPGVADRLGPYRAALQAELAGGTEPTHAMTKLRPLRAQLGVSEEEHAALAYAMQAPGGGGAPRRLAEGALFLDRYRVQRPLGQGAHGMTWLVRDERVGRDAVLKVLRVGEAGGDAADRVLREARALGAVGSANVVTLYDVQQVGDEVFLVMEHLSGGSLGARLQHGPLDPRAWRTVALGTLRALEAVHGAGLVHRDVKPSNLLLAADGEAKLADFGVAHLPGLEATRGGPQAVGTVQYMSPEQARGRTATPRSDLYSAAATLFEALTGEPYLAPRPGEGAGELQVRAMSPGPFRRKLPGPPKLRAWFAKALDPDPAKRIADARAMRGALERAVPEQQARV